MPRIPDHSSSTFSREAACARSSGRARAIALLAIAISALSGACGKVGPPLPPLGKTPTRVTQLAATQVGGLIRLTWSAPRLDLSLGEDAAIRRADVYRLRQDRNVPPLSLADDFEAAADIVGFLDYETLKKQLKDTDKLSYEDTLDLGQSAALLNTRFQYAVRYVDARGRPQQFSNLVSIEPVPGIARPPSQVAATERQDAVVLTWTAPDRNIDGTAPAQVIGYNLYRAKPGAPHAAHPLNDRLITGTTYTDANFLYQTPYVYIVRSVSQGPDQTVESSDSQALEITPRDVFPPAAPSNVTVASAGSVVSLFWPTNSEPDVVGYFVYRADGEVTESGRFARITDKPVTRTSFKDDRVSNGQRYSYRITAVDRYGNESAPSSIVTEIASP